MLGRMQGSIATSSWPNQEQQPETIQVQDESDLRIGALEQAVAAIAQRLTAVETKLADIADQVAADQKQLKRAVEMKTARSGEMSSRIAQRIAKLEAAVEILSRCEGEDAGD